MIKIYLTLAISHALLFASFSGALIDKKTSKPISGATISDSKQSIKTDKKGKFSLKSSEKKYFVKAYGYRPYHFNSDSNTTTISVEPITIKALYLNFWGTSNNSPKLKNVLNIVDKTDINTIVVDVKNEKGSTSFLTSFKQANSYGAHKERTNRNISKFMNTMKSKNIYTIARIVTFKDELQAINNLDYAVRDANGTLWRNIDKNAWVDPFDKRAHHYAISVAEEAAKVGFDEINFDYIRFPAKESLVYSQENNATNRIKAISDFLDLAQKRLRKYGVFISVDTYGNICWVKDDSNIGQTVTSLAEHADYLSPMLYPSGFSSGSFKFKYPSERPYSVIHRSITNIHDRIDPKRVRPWLQHFRDYAHRRVKYKKFHIQEQIRAAKHTETSGWMMWSPSSKYHESYFLNN